MSVSSSRSDRSGRSRTPAVESAVTRLLVSIKQLLESLTKWSQQQMSEDDVSDVYVRLGNDFNAAVAAFASYNIDMSELLSVPDDLRMILEDCLSEEPTSVNLDKYLPKVRAIITGLLQGLRTKQSTFRQIVSSSKHRSDASASGHSRTDSRVSRSDRDRTSRRDTRGSSAGDEGASTSRRNTAASVASTSSSSGRRRDTAQSANGEDPFVGGFSPNLAQPMPTRGPPPQNGHGLPERPSSSGRARPPAPAQTPPVPPPYEAEPANRASQPPVPSHVKRYSLVDKPISPPAVVIDEASPDPNASVSSPPPPNVDLPDRQDNMSPAPEALPDATSNPGVASSLAALKQSDALERRASKRFSTYNISKMTGVPRERVPSTSQGNRRSMAASNTLTPAELATLADESGPSNIGMSPSPRKRSQRQARGPSPMQEIAEEEPPVPPLPPTAASTPSKPDLHVPSVQVDGQPLPTRDPSPSPELEPDGPITIFMQVGREVKKARMEPGQLQSLNSLRVLFVDKFAYNPGQGNFPAIYIRDLSSGVQYELEDMEEIKDKCLLSLNIEPLDQIKEHIDSQISNLTQELRDLRTAVGESNRRSSVITAHPPPLAESPVNTVPTPRPSDAQLRGVARRLSRLVSDGPHQSQSQSQPSQSMIQPQTTGQTLMPQFTGMSTMSDASNRIVADLRTQFDEVQNLRRDLGTMRQLYTEFASQTKEALGGLRSQTARVRELASNQVPGARAYIDEGKAKLDTRSQNVLTKMEELQDTVEQVKDDVLKRQISPRAAVMKSIRDDVVAAEAELRSLTEHIKTVKPMWKKTWEEELQSIVEEQQFLNHQEEFLSDLVEDHKAVVEVFGHVEKVISIRGAAGSRGARRPNYRPPPPEEGHNGLSTVMLEIQGAAVDPERRMKAIAANQKNRERDLRARGDQFENELQDRQTRLNKTGGAEEVERVRQKRNDMTLKAMFNPNPMGAGPRSPGSESAPLSPTSERG
ncbi:AIP3-domain-containing protein [Peniophora sp. CONT]|nr:AIP3-domain-containing protein [Peniophora sp. CONT]